MRVAQASDVLTLPYAQQLVPGARVWVDNNGSGLWQVLEKTDPFVLGPELTPEIPEINPGFGRSVAQGQENIVAMIGAPFYNSAAGAVYPFLRGPDGEYLENPIIQLNATATMFS